MKIEKRITPAGTVSWRLDMGVVDGVRVRRTYQSKLEAEGALALAKIELRSHGERGQSVTVEDRGKLADWMGKLPIGVGVDDVFRFYLAHAAGGREIPPVETLFRDYSSELMRLNRTLKYVKNSVTVLTRFFEQHPDTPLDMINRDHVQPFVLAATAIPTQRNRLGAIRAFYEWLIASRYVSQNPTTGAKNRIRISDTEEKPILALGIVEVKALLAVAQKEEHLELLGFVSLALFCGIRPEEIYTTDASHLSLPERFIRITAKASKTGQNRVIPLCDTAHNWLSRWRKACPKDKAFRPPNFQKRWKNLRDEAGLFKGWVPDVLRHTFASFHYSEYQNENQLKALLGHSLNEGTLFRHYRAVQTVSGETITKRMAEEFWALTPSMGGKNNL
jgi:integrase